MPYSNACISQTGKLKAVAKLMMHADQASVSLWTATLLPHRGKPLVTRPVLYSFIHSLHAFQSVDQVRCSRHFMAALQPALS